MIKQWNIWIDTGGTFTDCLALDPAGKMHKTKVLSSSTLRGSIIEQITPRRLRVRQSWNAPYNFIKHYQLSLLDNSADNRKITGYNPSESIIEVANPLPELPGETQFEVCSGEEAPILAARLITKTALENPLPPMTMRLATTRATNALLAQKGSQVLYCTTRGFGDLLRIRYQQRPRLFELKIDKKPPLYSEVMEIDERTGFDGSILEELDFEKIKKRLEKYSPDDFDAVAICLINSYKNTDHEKKLAAILKELGFEYITASSKLVPRIGMIQRAETTVVNTYLAPVMENYIQRIQKKMDNRPLLLLNSAGGLTKAASYTPKDSLLSGPAGGVVGASAIGKLAGYSKILSFDMGGTSTDVARFDGDFVYQHEHEVGSAHIAASALAIETVAAGGGSVCSFDGHALKVGPDSAGAKPGPACYGAGGPLTLTDVNLLLGRLHTSNFSIPVKTEAAEQRLSELLKEITETRQEQLEQETLLAGFLTIANERMAETIQKISMQKGYDPSEYALVAFGGAGGQHACAVADLLDISTILYPIDAGLLSAYGLGKAVPEQIEEKQIIAPLEEVSEKLKKWFRRLEQKGRKKLKKQGVAAEDIEVRKRFLYLRFRGQEHSLELPFHETVDLYETFKSRYKLEFGHWIEHRPVEAVSIRVVISERRKTPEPPQNPPDASKPEPDGYSNGWFGRKRKKIPYFRTRCLQKGASIEGPALLLDPNSTLALESGWRVNMIADTVFKISRNPTSRDTSGSLKNTSESVALELFTNRFTAIAEEMGEMLQRTALSVNIKERRDFSCALLNEKGELIVNAPHIPVHLGALGLCVRRLMETVAFRPGDCVITNHPAYGGSHLPDITIVTPVFTTDNKLTGFAASRAHHAEIGGTRPGSMPPQARTLAEEGVVIPPIYLIKQGKDQWEHIKELLTRAPYPTRSLDENLADIRAAVAANHRGATKLVQLCEIHGREAVTHYMKALKQYAAGKMRGTLRSIKNGRYESSEYLDDGTPLKAAIEVWNTNITFDFKGTGGTHPKNLNATPAIVQSVIMYVLRVLVEENLPLNEGLLDPVDIHLPVCLLNPAFPEDPEACPAIVGGNTEVSQRLVDLLLKPFNKMACSQGTMNNVLFGNDKFGYYETIGGGTGAGPDFDGTDGVHHHMSNTRGTDPEVLEQKYPVRLIEYSIRKNSGGRGRHYGGNGIIRKMVFEEPVSVSVLTQHRTTVPYGLKGGESGQPGEQYIIQKDGRKKKLSSIDGADLKQGDQLIIKTPGGGGYGK